MNTALSLTFTTDARGSEASPPRMGGAAGSAVARPSLLDRLIEERRRGDCADPRRPPRPAAPSEEVAVPAAPSPRAPVAAGERSLDELVASTWESLTTAETASCLLCGGDLLPRFGAGARPVGGRCGDCGTELS